MPEAPLIIRGGQTVPPLEVERILLSHPAVAEAAVVGVPDPFWDEIVTAAVRLSAPLPAAAADLTGYCRERLAPYKVPVRWLFTPTMPRTRTGLICRATLATQLAVMSLVDGSTWSAHLPAALGDAGPGGGAVPFRVLRPRVPAEDLAIPRQVRRSGGLEDLDYL
jgi:AMP-binding enzyme C-terminal domain